MDSLVSSSIWAEHFASEVGDDQPLLSIDAQTPAELYLQLRESACLRSAYPVSHPWLRSYPPLEALAQLTQSSHEPFIPSINEALPIAFACQLALLWAMLGCSEAASQLAAYLKPLVQKRFFSLWTPEKTFHLGEAKVSFALFLRALGYPAEADRLYQPSLPKNRFFAWLFQQNIKIDLPSIDQKQSFACLYELIEGEHSTCALTLHETKSQAGACSVNSIQIPAFGPHGFPLSDSDLFGIQKMAAEKGWFSSSAIKDAWFQISSPEPDSFRVQVIGVEPERPLYFVFYVCASDCQIAGRHFKPKSLLRFSGEGDSVVFKRGLDQLTVTTTIPLSIELIPLSEGESFWGASFLLAFRLPSATGQIVFKLQNH